MATDRTVLSIYPGENIDQVLEVWKSEYHEAGKRCKWREVKLERLEIVDERGHAWKYKHHGRSFKVIRKIERDISRKEQLEAITLAGFVVLITGGFALTVPRLREMPFDRKHQLLACREISCKEADDAVLSGVFYKS